MKSFFPASKGFPHLAHPVSREVLTVMRDLLIRRNELATIPNVEGELAEQLREVNAKLNFLGDNYTWFKKLISL